MSTISIRRVPVARRMNSTTSRVKVSIWSLIEVPSVTRTPVGTHVVDFGAANTVFSLGKDVFNEAFKDYWETLSFHGGKFTGRSIRSQLEEALNNFTPSDGNDGAGHHLVDIYVDQEGWVYAT